MSNTASTIALKVREDFIKKNADLLACLDKTPAEIMSIVMSAAELDRDARQTVMFYVEGVDQSDAYARKVARDDFHRAMYEITAKFFCEALSDGVIGLSIDATPEADAQLLELSYVIGNAQRPAPPPPTKSAAELLDEQIREDWAHLPAEKIRAKENDPKYKKRLRELLDSDAIKSQATSKYDVGEVGV